MFDCDSVAVFRDGALARDEQFVSTSRTKDSGQKLYGCLSCLMDDK